MELWKDTKLILSHLWLKVFPTATPFQERPKDARSYALDALFDYLSTIQFSMLGSNGTEDTFIIPRCNWFIDPPAPGKTIRFPAVAVLPEPFNLDSQWLGRPIPVEGSMDQYADGTMLVINGEYFGQITLDVWSSTAAQRSSIIRAFETSALWTEDGPLYFSIHDYYDRIAVFEYLGHTRIDTGAFKDRWQVQIRLSLRIESAMLVSANELLPKVTLDALQETR